MKKISQTRTQGLTASELAKLAGVSVNTVRYYLLLGLLAANKNPQTGRRVFSPANQGPMAIISQLNKTGYTLQSIREIFAHRWKTKADPRNGPPRTQHI